MALDTKLTRMVNRLIEESVRESLKRQAAVVLVGPRQVGKTTLALKIGESCESVYLDLEDLDDRNKLAEPKLFLERHEDKLVILDEIHRMPDLFETLRGVIDRGRRRGKGKGRFLLLGSGSIELMQKTSETLAGRIAPIEMSPITVREIEGDRSKLERLWLRGGFPDSYLATSARQSTMIKRDFIRTYLERDVAMFGPRIPTTTLHRLWTMLAHKQGSLLNGSDLGRALEIDTKTVNRYIDLLSDLYLVRRLPPYLANVSKRLVKTPKVYVRDSGLLHALLRIDNLDQLAGNPVVGMSWEGFVIEAIAATLPWASTMHFYRTSAGAEVDLVIENPDKTIWAIEIKRALSGKVTKGFHIACEDLQPAKAFVVHAADDRYPVSDKLEAISIRELMAELASADEDR